MSFDIETIKAITEATATAIFTTIVVAATLWKKLKTTKEDINQVKNQMLPNGGSSLADKVNKVLEELSAYRRSLMDLVPDPMFKTNSAGSCIWINIAYCDKFGVNKDHAIGTGWVEVVHPEDRTRIKEEFLSCVEDRRMFDQIYRMRNKITGQEFKVQCRSIPVINENKDEIISFLGIITFLES